MLEKKAKKSGRLRRTFFSILGSSRSRKLLSFILRRKHNVASITFPVKIDSTKEILMVLPEEHLHVLLQLKNVISLMALFKHAGITLLCEKAVAPYIKMIPGLTIVEYDAEDHFSSELSKIAQQFKGNVDICFLLDAEPDLSMLYLAGSTAAPVRVGYSEAGDFPFLNLQIRPSSRRVYLADWYSTMAEVFGSKPGEIRWRVAQKTIEEVDHLIKELKMKPTGPLIGFDAIHFIRTFGMEWTENFIRQVNELHLGTSYFHVENRRSESELVWLCKQNVPLFADLSASRLAALVSKSKIIIAGNTPMYALAGLLHRPAVGFFRETQLQRYCPQNALLKGVEYSGCPDPDAVDRLLSLVKKQVAPKVDPQ